LEIYERIKELRKQHLKLSQERFGEMLGVNRDVINNIERNRLAKPEQKEPLYRLICETFHVNYSWLTSGIGEMFVVTNQTFLERLSTEYGLSDTAKSIIECYLNLNDEQRSIVDDFVKSVAESIVESSSGDSGAVDNALDKMIYRAAYSESHTEHEVIKDGNDTIDKLSKIPSVTSKDEF